MTFPEEQYYELNRILLSAIGLWPYDNSKIGQVQVILSLLIFASFISTQLMKLVVSEYNLNLLLEILSFALMIIAWAVKYITFYAVVGNIKTFQEHIRSNWGTLKDNRELQIIREYSNTGRLFTITIATSVYLGIFMYLLTQYIPNLLDIIIPLNESRPRKLSVRTEYFVDEQEHFHLIALHIDLGLFITATTGIATESFALANSLHAFGMFKIASYRMERILSENNQRICITKKYMASRNRIMAAVDIHRRAIEFSELLKTSFGSSYLLIFMLVEFSASINLFHLFYLVTMKNEISEIAKCFIFIFFHFLFLILGNYAGQEFINSDINVYRTICNTQWYNAPLTTQKLILFLIQKTTKSYKVDAGGMFNPCLEGLATAFSMQLSYFTVLCSL